MPPAPGLASVTACKQSRESIMPNSSHLAKRSPCSGNLMPLAAPQLQIPDGRLRARHRVIGFFGFGAAQAVNRPIRVPPRAGHRCTARDMALRRWTIWRTAPPAVAVAASPSVETPLHKLFCVEYARMRSGMNIFGDAKYWWDRAHNLYARMSSGRTCGDGFAVSRLKRGHVAVVSGSSPRARSGSTRPIGKITARSITPCRCWT